MRSRAVALVAFGTYLSLACGGCLSNEYVIPKTELARLSRLPPSQRGARVHVVQELGASNEWAVENGEAMPEAAYGDEFAIYDRPDELARAADLDIQLLLGDGPGGAGWHPSPPRRNPWPQPLPRDRPHGSSSSGGGGGNLNLGNIGGGGGGGGDDLAIFAIIVVAVAVMAAAGLAVTEGIRYDGFVQLHPQQPVHLRGSAGGEQPVPLDSITPADVAGSEEAVVRDDAARVVLQSAVPTG